jgi:hypothetical protein
MVTDTTYLDNGITVRQYSTTVETNFCLSLIMIKVIHLIIININLNKNSNNNQKEPSKSLQ